MLTLCNCLSDAEGSRNGARYSAQDKMTGCMYELRCLPVDLSNPEEDMDTVVQRHQPRLDTLILASQQRDVSSSVAFPIDVYFHRLVDRNELFLVSVSAYTGLSLGDVIRSGCRLVEEADFGDILRCVEAYGLASTRLPPHGNLSLSALARQMIVRPGAAEVEHPSRWVVGDWLLLGENIAPTTPGDVVRDLEWLLYSAFSKLNVLSDSDGSVLRKEVVETRINETIEKIRKGLVNGVGCSRRASTGNMHADENAEQNTADLSGEKIALPSLLTPESTLTRLTTKGSDSADELLDRVALHRHKLSEEQQILQSYANKRKESIDKLPSFRFGKMGGSRSDDSRRRVRFVEIIQSEGLQPEKSFSSITSVTEQPQQQFGGRKDAVLCALTAAVDAGIQCDISSRNADLKTKCKRRDTLLSTLMRLATMSSKRNKSNVLDTINEPQEAETRAQNGSVFCDRKSSQKLGSTLHVNVPADNDGAAPHANTSPTRWPQKSRPGVSSRTLPPAKFNGKGDRSPLSDFNEVSMETTTSSATLTPNTPRLHSQKNPLSLRRSNKLNSPLQNGQREVHTRRVLSDANTTKKSAFRSPVVRGGTPATPNRRPWPGPGTKWDTALPPRRNGQTTASRRITGGNRAATTLNCTPFQRTSRNPNEAFSALAHPGRNGDAPRVSHSLPNGSVSVGRVSRRRVQPVNERSFGVTIRRRNADVNDGIL